MPFEYKLLYGVNSRELSQTVNDHLANGWILHGSPTARSTSEDSGFVYQAVLRAACIVYGEASLRGVLASLLEYVNEFGTHIDDNRVTKAKEALKGGVN